MFVSSVLGPVCVHRVTKTEVHHKAKDKGRSHVTGERMGEFS